MSQLIPEQQFSDLKKQIVGTVKDLFPVQGKNTELRVHDVWVDDNKDSGDIRAQKTAILKGRTWSVPVYADFSLHRGGKQIDRKKVLVMHLPKITDRFGYIIDGNEYQTSTQLRLKSGVYHRRAANDQLLAEVNLANRDQFAKGKSFKIRLDPDSAIFYLKFENSNIPLYHLLRSAGVSDSEMERRWGKEILEKNQKKLDAGRAFRKFHKAVGEAAPAGDESQLFATLLAKTELLSATTKKTLGKAFRRVDGEVLLRSTGKLLGMSRGEYPGDDKPSLEFLSVHDASDLIPGRLRKSALRIRRKIQNNIDRKKSVRGIVPTSELDKAVKGFFYSSLVTQGDQTNPLEMLSGHRKTTIMGEQGGIKSSHAVSMDSKLINPSHLGFLDPIHTPEGEKTGVSLALPLGVRKKGNDFEALFMDARTGRKKRLSPAEALEATIAFPDQYIFKKGKPKPAGKVVTATRNGEMVYVKPGDVDYVIPSARGIFGVSSNLIPFLQNNQGNRAMTAARQQEQAVPLEFREAPLVQVKTDSNQTFEEIIGKYASRRSPVSGIVDKVGKDSVVIRVGRKKHEIQLYDNFPLKGHTLYDSEVLVKKGDKVRKGQLVADSTFTKNGTLALGTNLFTAYIPFKGYNFEDGVVISESAAKKLTSLHLHRKDASVDMGTIISRRKFLAEHPYTFKKGQVNNVGDDGVVAIGSEVSPGDPLVLVLKKPTQTKHTQSLRTFRRGRPDKYRDRSIIWDSEYKGIVTDIVKKGSSVTVYVKTKEPAQQGDKLVGRHGNKGIITRIVPDSEMPYKMVGEEQRHVEIALNPLGVPGRINLGQVLETAAGNIAEVTGKTYEVKNFERGKDYLESLKKELKEHGISDKSELINPETGKPYKEKVLVGNQYILKLQHQVVKKQSARSGGFAMPYSINHSPVGGAPHGGQALGELGLYTMLAHGARENLHEMFTYKSSKNDELWDALREGTPLPPPKVPFAQEKFLAYLNAMRVNVRKEGNNLVLVPFMEKQITGRTGISNGEIKEPGLALRGKDLKPEKGGLFDEKITGGPEGTRWSHFTLSETMPNPLFEDAIKKLAGLTDKRYRALIGGDSSYKGKKGGAAVAALLKDIDIKKELKATRERLDQVRGEKRNALHQKYKILRALEANDLEANVYMMKSVPVIPPIFRPIVARDDGNLSSDDLNGLYKDVGAVNEALAANKKAGVTDKYLSNMRLELYDGLKALTGTGGSLTRSGEYKGILDIISGRVRKATTGRAEGSPKYGFFQKGLMKRRQDFSGRSTIVPEPRMGIDELGVPEDIAWKMYQPFVERELIRAGYKPLEAFDAVKKRLPAAEKALDKAVQERPILLKRDPALHKFNILAFKPRIVRGKAIEIHPLVTSGYNADFDGDAMSVYLPIGSKAVKEAHGMYPSNNLFSPSTGAVQYTPGHEALLGLYLASVPGKRTNKAFSSPESVLKAHRRGIIDTTDIVKVRGKETTVGRLKIETILPDEFTETGKKPLRDMRIFDTKTTKSVLMSVAKKHPKLYGEITNSLKDLGNDYSTNLGFSIGLNDFTVINRKERDRLVLDANKKATRIRRGSGTSKRKEERIVNLFADVDTKLDKLNSYHLDRYPTNISTMVRSGARGSFSQLKQIVSSPILVKDGKDRVVPYLIPKSYSEGMDLASYWTTMHGARKGTIQKTQGVRDPGYISKQLINSTMNQVVTDKDCGTKDGIWLSVDDKDVLDRYLAAGFTSGGRSHKSAEVVTTKTLSAARKGRRSQLFVRSPMRCESDHGICQTCAGLRANGNKWDIGTNLGVIAGQAIGEPSTQLSLNVFHTGGLAKGKGAESRNTFKRLEQVLRMPRNLPNSAPLALVSGTVRKIEGAPQGGEYIYIGDKKHYVPITQQRTVRLRQKVRKGDALSNGVIDPKKLLGLKDLHSVQSYLAGEIHGVISSASPVRKRNIEVVVKALTNVTQVEDPGGHPDWVPGDMKPYSVVRAWNAKKSRKGREVKHNPVLKGVDVLPLSMQEDWVARLQFNKLGRTIVQAAREGWSSNIHGFHPIPALAYAKEFGKKTSVKDWRGQY